MVLRRSVVHGANSCDRILKKTFLLSMPKLLLYYCRLLRPISRDPISIWRFPLPLPPTHFFEGMQHAVGREPRIESPKGKPQRGTNVRSEIYVQLHITCKIEMPVGRKTDSYTRFSAFLPLSFLMMPYSTRLPLFGRPIPFLNLRRKEERKGGRISRGVLRRGGNRKGKESILPLSPSLLARGGAKAGK